MAKSHVISGWFRAPGLALALAGVLLTLSPGGVGAEICVHHLTFTEKDLEYCEVEGYDVIALRGARFLNRPGRPRLPLVPVRLALPAGVEVRGFSLIVRDSSELRGDFVVLPSQPPQSLSARRSFEFVAPLEAVYKCGKWYPECAGELVGSGRLGGVTICDMVVYPLRYHPLSGKVVLLNEIEIEVTYERPLLSIPTDPSGLNPELVRGLVANGSGSWRVSAMRMDGQSPGILGDDEISYLIITCDSLKPYFEPLAAWKSRKGLPSEIITTEGITTAYTGCDLQEKIRNCLKDYHSTHGTVWVLLGGDAQVIPDRKAYVPLSDKPYLPCDLYYSDLDGTWNADGDLYWGEVPSDNLDMYADVFIGRAPVSNRGQVATFVDKVLTYEGVYGLPQDYQLDMFFAAEVLWGDPEDPSHPDYTDGGEAKDLIDSIYVPGRFAVYRRYESLGNLNLTSVLNLLNQGMGITNILCHGQYHSISIAEDNLTESDFESLTNGPRYGFLYAVTCLSGGFDQTGCMGESWILSPAGGGFFLGNSRYGWNCPCFPGEGPSDYYDQSFFESVFVTGFTNLGKAHADAKHEFVAESRTDLYMRYVMYGLNLLGDPETGLWTDQPLDMEIAFEDMVPTGSQTFVVEVTSQGSPVPGAQVCLSKGEDVYCIEESDYQGKAYLVIEPGQPGTLLVTSTKGGYLPAMGEASVVNQIPPAVPQDVWAEEDMGPTALVAWSPAGDEDLAAYNIYRNTSLLPEFLTAVVAEETTYCDTSVVEGWIYYYWISSVDSLGLESSLSEPCSLMVSGALWVPNEPDVGPAVAVSPNPFTGTMRLSVRGRAYSRAQVDVYDVEGRWIRCIQLESDGAGTWQGWWHPGTDPERRLSPGIYVVRVTLDDETSSHKVILLR